MNETLKGQLSVFNAAVAAWALGTALLTEKLVQCAVTGDWTAFTFPDWQLGAFAAVFAGPATLILKRLGWLNRTPDPKETPDA